MPDHLLSWITLTPLIGMIVVIGLPRKSWAWGSSLLATLVPLVLASALWLVAFRSGSGEFQLVERVDWIRAIRAEYHVGIDGLSLGLVWLTTLLFFIAVLASRNVERGGKAFFALLLLLEVGVLGVLLSLDAFLFLVFWELALLPIFFLIGIFGGASRERAAVKFLVHSLVGSALLLVAIVALRLDSGTFSIPTWIELSRAGRLDGSHLPGDGVLLGMSFRTWCFSFLLIGFAIRLAIVPLHGWLVDLQTAAPAPLAMLLPAIVVKLGALGLLRTCLPVFPEVFREFAFALGVVGALGVVYGALVAAGQKDLVRVVAHVSIAQIGLVLLGIATLTEAGMDGAAQWMLGHGLSIAALTLIVFMFRERNSFAEVGAVGAAPRIAPRFVATSAVAFSAVIGVPVFAHFAGQYFVLRGSFGSEDLRFDTLAILAMLGLLIGAIALLRALLCAYFGKQDERSAAPADLSSRETLCAALLLGMCLVAGVLPRLVQEPLGPSVARLFQAVRGP